jgi:acetyl-CoA carboxylase beta subunit
MRSQLYGFQRSEFLLEQGMLDAVVPRQELKGTSAGHCQS